ncbi:MAG: class II aldolase [Xanthomonadaceae bacterium]|nr:class II aldolase [Xanthomonadaceae bacterium]
MSARLGVDRASVQGGGGNTSYKSGDDFWVKASGTWLAHAETEDIFVHLPLSGVRAAMAETDPEAALRALAPPGGPRPSIETSLHALMPQAVVLHVHSVNTIAHAVRTNAETALAARLDGLRWAWVPYRRPGLPLTDAVREALSQACTPPDVLVLGSHGLVVAGNDYTSAEARLRDVEARLALPARTPSPPDFARLEAVNDAGWRIADDLSLHAIGIDPVVRAIALRGALYPDHVVFLGERAFAVPGANEAGGPMSLRSALAAASERGAVEPAYAIVEGAGVLLSPSLSPGACAMLGCLADVGLRLDDHASLRFLTLEDVAALMGWEAEAYRRTRDAVAPDAPPVPR